MKLNNLTIITISEKDITDFSKVRNLKLREAKYDDFEEIMKLQDRYSLQTKNYNEWQHLWKENPVIKDEKSFPIGWVLENNDRKIVGYLGNIPLAYEFSGRKLMAAATTSFVVDRSYRNSSLLLMNAFFKQRNVDLFLNTTANYEGEKVFSAFKARKIPSPSADIALFWITGYQGFIASLFLKKKVPLGCLAKYPLSLGMRISDKLIRRNQYLEPRKRMKIYERFDERFNVFWEKLSKKYSNRILGIRDQAYLDWHFRYALAQKKIWIFVAEQDSKITSYAIFLRQDNPEIGLNRVRLIDFQTIEDDFSILQDMIFFGIKKCKEEGIYVLEIIGFNENKRTCLKKCLPYKRKLLSWPFLYKAKDNLLSEELNNPQVWDPCFYDGDASI